MPDVICNTSPIQYLHQLHLLELLGKLSERVIVPPAVVAELSAGKATGVDLPDVQALAWVTIRQPVGAAALPLVTDLGPGETEVLMLGLEQRNAVVILDDALARRIAVLLGLRFTGTLGVLLDVKRRGLLPALRPILDQLDALRFRIAPPTRKAILALAGESEE